MNLIKTNWTKQDGKDFIAHLKTKQRQDKIEWTRRIINTKMPLLAIPTPELKLIAKEIAKGNFISFIKLNLNDFYESQLITGLLICKVKDFNLLSELLNNYAKQVDNWASCDLLKFNINKTNQTDYFNLSKKMYLDKLPFVRRIGIIVWFQLINTNYLTEIFALINKHNPNEQDYYVNMATSWFIAECFIKNRTTTLQFLEENLLNKFTINKAISKCHDSYRVSSEDKVMLNKFKK